MFYSILSKNIKHLSLGTISRHIKDENIYLHHSNPVSYVCFLSWKLLLASTETDLSLAQSAL